MSDLTEISNGVVLSSLKHHGESVGIVFGLEGDHVVIVQHLEDLGQVGSVDSELVGAIASEVIKGSIGKTYSNKRDVGRVHGLDGDFLGTAVEVAVSDKILDRVNDLLHDLSIGEACFKHGQRD